MVRLGRRPGAVAAAALAAVAALLAGCAAGASASRDSSGNAAVRGGTATIALPPDVTSDWILPFSTAATASVYNSAQFQQLMYRPLYMFGGDTGSAVQINYPLSPAQAPVYSNGGRTVTVTMKGWHWSDGETVSARDVVFFLNLTEAEKPVWADYSAGMLPDNLTSYSARGNTLTINFSQAYSSLWFTYNQLAELTPLPLAWDITDAGAAAGSGGCTTDTAADGWAKCKAVYNFLTAQAKSTKTYASDPLWGVVDGPWQLSAYAAGGAMTMVPNAAYSGSPKPQLAAITFEPFTSDDSEYKALTSGQVDIGYVPPEDLPPKPENSVLPATSPLGTAYRLKPFFAYRITYAQPNFNNPQTGYIVRQKYVRQALQQAFDQPGIIKNVFNGYAVPTSGPAPNAPPGNLWIPKVQLRNNEQGPYPFSIAAATKLLTSHGWAKAGGVMTCEDPAKCGAGILTGQQLRLSLVYATGQESITRMWQAYKTDAAKAGIDITLVGEPFATILGESAPCAPMGPACSVQVFAYGGWNFDGPGYEPTGERLFLTGAGDNSGNYSDPTMNALINATHTRSGKGVYRQYAAYGAQQLPDIWDPSPYTIQAVRSTLRGVSFSALYTLLPEYWHFVR